MKHLLKGFLFSIPWWGSCAVYTYFHMTARPVWYLSDFTIWLYCFVSGIAFTYLTAESVHEEDRRAWEAMHLEVNRKLIDQSIALAPSRHSGNGYGPTHKESV